MSRYPFCMNKTDDNKKNSQSPKAKALFLQIVQEAHEIIAAAERALFVSRDAVEGCDPRLFIQPDRLRHRISAWFFIHIQLIPSAVALSTRRTFQQLVRNNLIRFAAHLAQRQQLYAVTLVV